MALTLIKAAHTLAWFSIESCMAYVLYAGAARRTDRRAALAGAVVAGESLVFAINGFRCPLTQLAERFGAADGSVTDIWLPRWFAHNLPAIHVPLLATAAYLNGRNLRQRQRLHHQASLHRTSSPLQRHLHTNPGVSQSAARGTAGQAIASTQTHDRNLALMIHAYGGRAWDGG